MCVIMESGGVSDFFLIELYKQWSLVLSFYSLIGLKGNSKTVNGETIWYVVDWLSGRF